MKITIEQGDILKSSSDLLVLAAYQEETFSDPFMMRLQELFGKKKIEERAKAQKFEGKEGQTLLLSGPNDLQTEYVLLIGFGAKNGEHIASYAREATGIAIQTAQKLGTPSIVMESFGEDHEAYDAAAVLQSATEGLLIADYHFDLYKKEREGHPVDSVIFIAEDARDAEAGKKGIERAENIVRGVTLARHLVNTPAQDMTPSHLAETARNLAKTHQNIEVKILEEKDCRALGMNAYLAVSQGSEEPAKFIHLTYKPTKKAKKKVAVIGKGVTFDSGGLSLKPGNFMMTMKSDMAGSAAVFGLFEALGRLQPSIEVHGIVAAVENMPSGKAIRPGDVVKASNGKFIEILNTDAEGRLTLADALVYAAKLKPDYVIDLATLTGACVVGLGEEIAALMSNRPELAEDILQAAGRAGENLWQMPLEKRYKQLLKSEVADLRNIATSSYGGSITAGLFLEEFVEEGLPWAHLDIAGPAYAERPLASYLGKGGTGFGVRTLIEYLNKF